MDLLVADGSSSQISDQIKDILFQKSASKLDSVRPEVAASLFGDGVNFDSSDEETEFETDIDLDDTVEA